jgi:CzcA family heavy metal efflux pump
MRWIIQASLKYRLLVIGLATVMMGFGILRLPNMPVDVFPEFAPPTVEIQAEASGLSTVEVEQLLTLNLEEALTGTAHRTSIRSQSVPGLSSIMLLFEPGTDFVRARQFVQERLTVTVGMPKVSRDPQILEPRSATGRVMAIGLSSKDLSQIDLSTIAFWKVRPRLLAVPGVANVALWGQRPRQLQVQVDPEQLRAQGVPLDTVIQTTGNSLWVSELTFLDAHTPGNGGFIDTPAQRLGIGHVLPISNAGDLARVAVDGTPLRLGELGQVVEGHPPLIGDAVLHQGGGSGVLLVVEKFPGSNTLEVTRGIDAALSSLRVGLPGVQMDSQIFRPANYIQMAIDNLTTTLLIGAVLMVLLLGLFLFEPRVVVITLAAIPLSLMAATLVLYLRGATLNVMVLAGFALAIGSVVDDAIIDIENIVRRLRQHLGSGGERSTQAIGRIVLDASVEVRGSIIFATLIIVLAVVPVFFLEGVSGAFFQPLALSYALALLASMVVALTVTPALSALLLARVPLERRQSPLVPWLQRTYGGALSRIIRAPRVAVLSAAAVVVVGAGILPFLGQSLLPAFKERDILVQWEAQPGTSHPEMARITERATRELEAVPGVRSVNAHLGRAVLGDQVVGINSSQLWISIDPKVNYEATLADIRTIVAGYPGAMRSVQTYLQDRIREVLGGGASEAIVVRIYGPELDILRSKAEEVHRSMAQIPGIADLRMDVQVEEPHIEVEVSLEKAQRYGLKPGDVRRSAATQVAGLHVGNLYENQKVFDVVVWTTPETRDSLTDIGDLLIDTPEGGSVRLAEIAEVRIRPAPAIVRHDANSRRIDVAANVHGRDLGSVVRDVETRLKEIQFPLEYHPKLLGEYAERQAAQQRILLAGLIAVFGIFLLLHAAFDSWRLAALAFVALPVALVGGLLAAFAGGSIVSLGSLVGFLAVLGIAARNGIMLINHYQYLEQMEVEPFGLELVMRGARERLVPILMTALATGLALVPLVVFGNIPGHEIEHPMAIVILGGLVTSTLLNLFIVPILYLRFAHARTRGRQANAVQ